MSKSQVQKSNSEVYQKIISYLFRNPDDISRLEEEWFLVDFYKYIFKGLKEMRDKELSFTTDEIFTYSKEQIVHSRIQGLSIQYSDIETIYNNFDEFTNISSLIKRIRNDYLKSIETAHIMEDLLVQYTSLDNIPLDKLKEVRDRIDSTINTIESDDNLPTVPVVMEKYLEITKDRGTEEITRTLGYPILNKYLPKSSHGGQMLLFFGESGSGKSLFVQSVINQMLNTPGRKIPIAYFTLEMSLEDVMDRFISMRSGLTSMELDKIHTDERCKAVFTRARKRLEEMDNLLIYDPSTLSLNDLDRILSQAEEYWKEKGILSEDRYKVVVLDLVTMISDFGEPTPQRMEKVINDLYRIYKKHNAFVIAVAQANENELRSEGRFKKPEQIKAFKLRKNSIKNGAALYERSRTVVALTRKREMYKTYFTDSPELWSTQPDLIDFDVIKNNKGGLHFLKFSFQVEPYKILPYVSSEDEV